MYKELVRRNVLILIVSLVSFFFISLFVISLVNNQNQTEDLLGLSKVLYNQVSQYSDTNQLRAEVNNFTTDQDWFSVYVANSDGQILFDTMQNSDIEGVVATLTKSELKRAQNLTEFETYFLQGNVCCIFRLQNGLICKTTVQSKISVDFFLLGTLFLIVTLAILIAISTNRVGKTSANVVNAFNSVTKNLRMTASGKYEPINTNHKYPEVEQAFKEINTVNASIYQNISKLSAERDKLNYIVENVAEGLIIIDTQGCIYAINDYARHIFRVDAVAKNTQYQQVITDSYCCAKINQTLSTRQKCVFDYHDTVTDKIYFSSINCFQNSQGESGDLISVVMYDVTWLRREQRNRADFIANASHELKTPITSISGFSELLSSGLITDPNVIKEYVGRIHNEAIYMKKTVDDLLYLSKLDYADGNFTESVSLLALAQKCAHNLDLIAAQKGVVVQVSGDELSVQGSQSLLEHMLSNLIDNAIKYNKPNGKVFVKVFAEQGCPTITVTDQGQGIASQHVGKMFDRFYRIDNSRSRETGGTGLGLSIVHKICTLHNAKIVVDSKVGVGTTFTVKFSNNANV